MTIALIIVGLVAGAAYLGALADHLGESLQITVCNLLGSVSFREFVVALAMILGTLALYVASGTVRAVTLGAAVVAVKGSRLSFKIDGRVWRLAVRSNKQGEIDG